MPQRKTNSVASAFERIDEIGFVGEFQIDVDMLALPKRQSVADVISARFMRTLKHMQFSDHSRIVVNAHICVKTTDTVFNFSEFSNTFNSIKLRLQKDTGDQIHFNWTVNSEHVESGWKLHCLMKLSERRLEDVVRGGANAI